MLRTTTTLASLALATGVFAQSATLDLINNGSGDTVLSFTTDGDINVGGQTIWHHTGSTASLDESGCSYTENNLFGTDVVHYVPYGTSCDYSCYPGKYNTRGTACTPLTGYCDGRGHCCANGACDTRDEMTVLTHYEWVSGYASPYDKNVYTMPVMDNQNRVVCQVRSYNTNTTLSMCLNDDDPCDEDVVSVPDDGYTYWGAVMYSSSDRMVRVEVTAPSVITFNSRSARTEAEQDERVMNDEDVQAFLSAMDDDELADFARENDVSVDELQALIAGVDNDGRRAPPTFTFPTFTFPTTPIFSYNRFYSYYRVMCYYSYFG